MNRRNPLRITNRRVWRASPPRRLHRRRASLGATKVTIPERMDEVEKILTLLVRSLAPFRRPKVYQQQVEEPFLDVYMGTPLRGTEEGYAISSAVGHIRLSGSNAYKAAQGLWDHYHRRMAKHVEALRAGRRLLDKEPTKEDYSYLVQLLEPFDSDNLRFMRQAAALDLGDNLRDVRDSANRLNRASSTLRKYPPLPDLAKEAVSWAQPITPKMLKSVQRLESILGAVSAEAETLAEQFSTLGL